MDTALPQKFPVILDRNLAKANCTEDRVCTSCDIVVLGFSINHSKYSKCRIKEPSDISNCFNFNMFHWSLLNYKVILLIYHNKEN